MKLRIHFRNSMFSPSVNGSVARPPKSRPAGSRRRSARPPATLNRLSSPRPVRATRLHQPHLRAFTMIEIAISLAVIGFALVAIIGILPAGMNVQKENRQETIITQDASVFMNAIRNGERGIDDLTNYVYEIRKYTTDLASGAFVTTVYTNAGGPYPLTSGLRIVGLLSTPKYYGTLSNYVVAYVRSISGLASEKFPQDNKDARDFALNYRMVVEVLTAHTNHFEPSWTNFTDSTISGDTNLVVARSNQWRHVRNLQANFHDVRLLFRWPYQGGNTGNGRQVFRTSVAGSIYATNEPGFNGNDFRLFFLQPRNYVQVKP